MDNDSVSLIKSLTAIRWIALMTGKTHVAEVIESNLKTLERNLFSHVPVKNETDSQVRDAD